jgi:hypothetical protein
MKYLAEYAGYEKLNIQIPLHDRGVTSVVSLTFD